MSDALQLLLPLADDNTRDLVKRRLLHGLKFFDGHSLRPEFTRDQAKLALLLVRLANPKELLSADERDLIESRMRCQSGSSATPAPERQLQRRAPEKHSRAPKPQKSARSKNR